jgi:hypothetical protein
MRKTTEKLRGLEFNWSIFRDMDEGLIWTGEKFVKREELESVVKPKNKIKSKYLDWIGGSQGNRVNRAKVFYGK